MSPLQYEKLWNKVYINNLNKNFLVPSIGFKVNASIISPKEPPPTLGGDTVSILNTIGVSDMEIDFLRNKAVIK